jgi:sialic acid synthase SpsE
LSVEVIAEIGVNHNGDVNLAKDLIEASRSSGADTVKFQMFDPSKLTSSNAKLAAYQVKNGVQAESQADMLELLTLTRDNFFELKTFAENLNLKFLVTPFDGDALDFLVTEMGSERVKISSGDLTNPPLLFQASSRGVALLVSTGMAELPEIARAVSVIRAGYAVHYGRLDESFCPTSKNLELASETLRGIEGDILPLTLMHCVSSYPAPTTDLNISSITALTELGTRVGYSDHAESQIGAVMSLALGATVFEKHITLNKQMTGPDHAASLTPGEFKDYVSSLREASVALGDGRKRAMPSELDARTVARRGVFASKAISAGEAFSANSLELLRPQGSISSQDFFDLINSVASRNYSKGESIE